jgi:acetolactate synthase small subunit
VETLTSLNVDCLEVPFYSIGQFLTLYIGPQVLGLVEIFRARIVDVTEHSLTIEVAVLSAHHFRVLQNGSFVIR